jgi:DNA-binding NtrC family response regulator
MEREPARASQSRRSHEEGDVSLASQDVQIFPLQIARRDASDAFERAEIAALMARTGGNVTRAAAIAEVSRQMLQRLLLKYGRDT